VCLVSPDPIGPVDERADVWADFVDWADHWGWTVAVMASHQGWLGVYEAAGMRTIYLGDEAIVDCTRFTLDGGTMKSLRGAHNRLTKSGFAVEFHDPATAPEDLRTEVLDVMTHTRQGNFERGFSMTLGRIFDPADTGLLLAIARDPDGHVAAFCQYIPAPDIDGWSLDLMRRRADPDMPNGVTDFVVIETIRHMRETGHFGLALNFAVLRGVLAGEREDRPFPELERRVLGAFSESMQIESLWKFNQKYRPSWRPRFVVVDAYEHAAAQGVAIADAEAIVDLPVIGRFLRPPEEARTGDAEPVGPVR
jgi:lysyl-tRNA synthetase class 2